MVTGADIISYTIGGNINGLVAGQSVVLQNNGGDNLTRNANGAFTFATAIASGSAYNVTVLTQPPGQTCTVANGSGTANANVTTVTVICNGVAGIPTLSEWAMLLLASLMVLAVGGVLRRQ